jgi:hypothetical protein
MIAEQRAGMAGPTESRIHEHRARPIERRGEEPAHTIKHHRHV